ncbi:MAG: O-antigen/teichoic acid export membrane protein [Roseivirga sp.]|jgi:O-antigen/teichoic acid export membrane protein
MSLKNKGIQGVKWTVLEGLIIQGLGFITTIVLTRLLVPEDFGLIGIIMVFLVVSGAIIEGGLGVSLIQDQKADKTDYSTVFIANLGLSLLLYPLLYFIAPFVAAFYEDDRITMVLRVLSLGMLISAMSTIQRNVLLKELAFKKLTLLRLPGVLIGSVVGIYCAFTGLGYWSLVVKELVTKVLDAIMLWAKSEWKPQLVFHKAKFRAHFNYGYKLMLTSILNSVFSEIYALIIGKMFSITTLGYYNRASKFIDLPRKLLITVITKPTFPLMSKIKDDKEKIARLYRQMIRGMFFFVAPTFIILAVIAKPLFQQLLTDKWLPSVEYFQILCLGAILYPIQNLNLNIFKVYGRTDLTLKLALLKKVLVLIVVLVGFLAGMKALLWGIVVSNYLSFFINTWYSRRMIHYSALAQVKDLSYTFLSVTISGVIGLWFIGYLEGMNEILAIISTTFAMILVYFLSSKLIKNPGLTDFLYLATPIVKSLRKKKSVLQHPKI